MRKQLKTLSPDAPRRGLTSWLAERVDVRPALSFVEKKTVPRHRLSGIYLLGGAALFLFGLQVVTGGLLLLYYQPSEQTAYSSVRQIMETVPYGWLIRSAHAWGANLFIGTVVLHFLTVLFTRAYRKPREMTWISGVLLLFLAVTFGFSGYLLPWNELSYYATLVGTEIPGTIPGIGPLIVHLLRGGSQVTGDTVTRFFAAHVFFLPLTAVLLTGFHVLLIQIQGMSLPLGMTKTDVQEEQPFLSEFLLLDMCVWLFLFGCLAALAILFPTEIGIEADPLKPPPSGIKPEWYFLFMFQTLKHVPEGIAITFFGVMSLGVLVLPFLDRRARNDQHSLSWTLLFVALLLYAATFEIWAALSPGVQHAKERLNASTYDIAGWVSLLVLLWCLLSFLIVNLYRLYRENRRVRHLYE